MSDLVPEDYGAFLLDLKTRIRRAQYQALRAANAELVKLYREIGESIHRKQDQVGWGKAVVETLARDLQAEFPGRNGFSAHATCGTSETYSSNTRHAQNCNRWLQKSVGPRIFPEAFRAELPSPEAIAERLRLWDGKETSDE